MTGPSLEPAAIQLMLKCLQESTRWSGCFPLSMHHGPSKFGIGIGQALLYNGML